MRYSRFLNAFFITLFAWVFLAVAGQAPGDSWTKLFSKADWYKDAEEKEQTFRGKLEALPKPDGFSTLQRASYYKLGDRTVFTTGKKVAALDKLVGKQVEILGKSVDMELEGRSLKEIWPAAIRLAPPPPAKKEK